MEPGLGDMDHVFFVSLALSNQGACPLILLLPNHLAIGSVQLTAFWFPGCRCLLPQGFALLWAPSLPVRGVQQLVSLPRAERVSAQ